MGNKKEYATIYYWSCNYHQFNGAPYHELSPEERLVLPASSLSQSAAMKPGMNPDGSEIFKNAFHKGKIRFYSFCIKHDILSLFQEKRFLLILIEFNRF